MTDPGESPGGGPDEELLRSGIRRAAGPGSGTSVPTERIDIELMLARVHRGARLRRARRSTGAAVAAVAAVVAATIVVPSLVATPDQPVAAGDQVVADPQVGSVAAAGDTVWVTVAGSCGSKSCQGLARSEDGGQTWSFTSTAGTDGLPASASHVELAPTASDGWAWSPHGDLAATHDGGASWDPVTMPAGSRVQDVVAGSDHAVALVRAAGHQQLVAAPVGADSWRPVDVPLTDHERLTGLFGGGDTFGAVVRRGVGRRAGLVVATGQVWQRRAMPCRPGGARFFNGELIVDTIGGTVWAACFGGGSTVVADSVDGSAWHTTDVPTMLGRPSMTVRADDTVLVAGGNAAYVVGTGGAPRPVDPQAAGGGSTGSDSAGYVATASADSDWLVTAGGALVAGSADDRSWVTVPVR